MGSRLLFSVLSLYFCAVLAAAPAQAGFLDWCGRMLGGAADSSEDSTETSAEASTVARAPVRGAGPYRENQRPAVSRLEEVYSEIILRLARQRGVPEEAIARVTPASLKLVALEPEGILMGATFVTQFVYFAVMGENPSHFHKERYADGDYARVGDADLLLNHPVESVTREEEDVFLVRFRQAAEELYPGIDGNLRRPTDKEWLAADGGAEWTDEEVHAHTWALGSARSHRTHAVGLKPPNTRGIYESRGHVKCSLEDLEGSFRALRGYSWGSDAWFMRTAQWYDANRYYSSPYIGFRVARAAPR
jgi:hypothetical protein